MFSTGVDSTPDLKRTADIARVRLTSVLRVLVVQALLFLVFQNSLLRRY